MNKSKNEINKNQIASNIIWRFADKWGSQLISLVIGVILARILDPEYYGIIAITNASIAIFSVFTDCGLGDSLIQKKDPDDLDYSTALVANVFLCVAVYIIIFFSAPLISNFYKNEYLTKIIRISSLTLLASGFKNIQHAYVAKNLLFKKYFFASILGTVGGGIIGVILAFNGFGLWALVFSNMFDVVVDTVVAWFSVGWWPQLQFSKERFNSLFSFGSKMLINSLINRVYSKLYQLIIGKFYTSEDLAYYDKGDTVTSKLTTNLEYAVNSVLFPVMSKKQDNLDELKKIVRKTIKTNIYIMAPIMIGLAVIANNAVSIVFTDKWLPAVTYIRIYCLIRMFTPLESVNGDAVRSLGKGDVFLKQQNLKRITSIIILFFTVQYGPLVMAYGLIISSFKDQMIQAWSSYKYLNYGYLKQLKDILPTLLIGSIMGIVVYLVGLININIYLLVAIQVLAGVIIYTALSFVTKNESFTYILDVAKGFLNK